VKWRTPPNDEAADKIDRNKTDNSLSLFLLLMLLIGKAEQDQE
jgi:hypothetical protein